MSVWKSFAKNGVSSSKRTTGRCMQRQAFCLLAPILRITRTCNFPILRQDAKDFGGDHESRKMKTLVWILILVMILVVAAGVAIPVFLVANSAKPTTSVGLANNTTPTNNNPTIRPTQSNPLMQQTTPPSRQQPSVSQLNRTVTKLNFSQYVLMHRMRMIFSGQTRARIVLLSQHFRF